MSANRRTPLNASRSTRKVHFSPTMSRVRSIEQFSTRKGTCIPALYLSSIDRLRPSGQAESMHGTQIRPARHDDEERIRRFLTGLSLHTQTLRFFTGITTPAAGLVRT